MYFACLDEHVGVWSCLFITLGPYENAKPKYKAKDAIGSKLLHKKIDFRGDARHMLGFWLKTHIVRPSVILVTQCGSLNQLLLKLLAIPEEFRAEPAVSSTSEGKTSQHWCVLGNIFNQGHSRSPDPSRNLPCFPLTSLLCIHSDPFVTNGALMCIYICIM